MLFDFTLPAFDQFCQSAARHPVFTLADYLSLAESPSAPYVILRFDVDYREPFAIPMARIAARHHLRGSFYFRHRNGTFDFETIKAVAALDHEVGYHFETMDTCRGDVVAAEQLFLEHLDQLRSAGLTIRTAAAHGAKPTAPTYRANFDLFTQSPGLFDRANLLGETTLSLDFGLMGYVSDAGWRWHRYQNYRHGMRGQPTNLKQVIRELGQVNEALCVTFHSQQWYPDPVSATFYRQRNRLGRLIRR